MSLNQLVVNAMVAYAGRQSDPALKQHILNDAESTYPVSIIADAFYEAWTANKAVELDAFVNEYLQEREGIYRQVAEITKGEKGVTWDETY